MPDIGGRKGEMVNLDFKTQMKSRNVCKTGDTKNTTIGLITEIRLKSSKKTTFEQKKKPKKDKWFHFHAATSQDNRLLSAPGLAFRSLAFEK